VKIKLNRCPFEMTFVKNLSFEFWEFFTHFFYVIIITYVRPLMANLTDPV